MGYKMKTKPASMRVIKTQPAPVKGRTCGECAQGCWNMENLNFKGRPFLIYCEHATYARNKMGRWVCLDNTPACERFIEGAKR